MPRAFLRTRRATRLRTSRRDFKGCRGRPDAARGGNEAAVIPDMQSTNERGMRVTRPTDARRLILRRENRRRIATRLPRYVFSMYCRFIRRATISFSSRRLHRDAFL